MSACSWLKNAWRYAKLCLRFMLSCLVLAAVAYLAGCANTPSGVKVVASSASYTNIGDINWDEYKIPVLSVYLGPRATVWVNRNYKALAAIEVTGVVTNTTSALGIYTSDEAKALTMRVDFHAETNGVPESSTAELATTPND